MRLMKQTLLMMTALSLGIAQANATVQSTSELDLDTIVIENNALTLSEAIQASDTNVKVDKIDKIDTSNGAKVIPFVPSLNNTVSQQTDVIQIQPKSLTSPDTEKLVKAASQAIALVPDKTATKQKVELNVTQVENSDVNLPVISKNNSITPSSVDNVANVVTDSKPITDEEIDDAISHLKSLNKKANKKDKELSELVKELTVKTEEQKQAALAELAAARAAKAKADKLAAKMAAEAARKKKLAQQQQQAKVLAKKNTFTPSNRAVTRKSAPAIAASRASRAALSRSIGLCAKYVRIALQSAGYRFAPNPSAYQYATRGTLARAGFVKISNSSRPQVGDVVVFHRTKKNPHGHIQIFDGRRWISDFRQKTKNPYRGVRSYTTWRDRRYLNHATVRGTYLAMSD